MPQPAPNAVAQAILQVIYAVFLGGLITAITVVGLTTFYPVGDDALVERIAELDERESQIFACQGPDGCEPTPAQLAEADELVRERSDLYEQQQDLRRAWERTAGLIAVGLATGLLALSLVRWDRAIVVSNGLLLGGLFTMVYGVGLTIAGGEDVLRFVILLAALAIVVVLGYLRFARVGPSAGATGPAGDLDGRVSALESRLDDLRRALG
jgi:hypothetical protein